jgi:hypothetical protein
MKPTKAAIAIKSVSITISQCSQYHDRAERPSDGNIRRVAASLVDGITLF